MSKSGKLVDYEGGSSDDEENSGAGCASGETAGTSGAASAKREEREALKPVNSSACSSPSSKMIKTNGSAYSSYSPQSTRSPPPQQNGSNGSNGHRPLSNGVETASASSGSNSSSRGSSPKDNGASNGKPAEHGDKAKIKWHHKWLEPSEQVYTKASAAGNNKGWHVCKDSAAPSSTTAANGWSVSDTVSDESNGSSRSNNHSVTPCAAEIRSFNGTNRSETVFHLQKFTPWAYGNSNVHSWNGGKARMDREVDNQRRQNRKRSFDDEDLDRGRTKKIKMVDHKGREDPKYNYFQEHQNNGGGPKWRLLKHHRPRNNLPYNGRPRHGGGNYNRPPHHSNRYHHNKSRKNWGR